MDLFMALDVSPASTALCALNAHGKVVKEAKVDSEPQALIAALRALPGKVVVVGLEAGPLSQWLHRPMSAHLDTLNAQIAELGQQGETSQTLQTMPGVGPVTALATEAIAPQMESFRRGRDFAAWLGRISKAGPVRPWPAGPTIAPPSVLIAPSAIRPRRSLPPNSPQWAICASEPLHRSPIAPSAQPRQIQPPTLASAG